MSYGIAREAVRKGKVKVEINAAGVGSRQGAVTDVNVNRFANIKPLLPMAGRSIIEFSIFGAHRLGVPEIRIGAGTRWEFCRKKLMPLVEKLRGTTLKIEGGEGPKGGLGDALAMLGDIGKEDTAIVMAGDIVWNFDLLPMLEAHLESGSAATIATLPVPWESDDWSERRFPIVIPQGTPRAGKDEKRPRFEARIDSFVAKTRGGLRKVDAINDHCARNKSPSSLSTAGVYMFSGELLMELARLLTAKEEPHEFTSLGHHVLPLLCGQYGEFGNIGKFKSIIRKIERREFALHAFTPQAASDNCGETYWFDISNPRKLLRINMLALQGMAKEWLSKDGRYNETGWGFVGKDSPIPSDVCIGAIPERNYSPDGITVVGSNATIGSGSMIGHSFIDGYTNLQPGTEVYNSVISLGLPRPTSYIGKTIFVNCLVLGEGLPPNFADIRMLRNACIFNLPYFDSFGMVKLDSKPDRDKG